MGEGVPSPMADKNVCPTNEGERRIRVFVKYHLDTGVCVLLREDLDLFRRLFFRSQRHDREGIEREIGH